MVEPKADSNRIVLTRDVSSALANSVTEIGSRPVFEFALAPLKRPPSTVLHWVVRYVAVLFAAMQHRHEPVELPPLPFPALPDRCLP